MKPRMGTPVQTIICIPGAWPTRADIVTAITRESDGLVYSGDSITDINSKHRFALEVYQHDPDLRRAFALAGQRSLQEADLQAITLHTYSLYVIGSGGSVKAARRMMRVGCGLLRAGGIAVKVESAGVAHSARDWFSLATSQADAALYHAYVILISKRDTYYSCGMHNLGLRDAIVDGEQEPDVAARLLETFLLYTLLENPNLASGHTFSIDAQAPRYRLTAEPCQTYPHDDLFHNPFGMWRLSGM